jgi:hypothetical protein
LIEQKNDKYKNLKKNDEYYSENSYIQVHIQKCKNIESVRNFQFILSRLLEVYYKEFDNISKVYRLYIKGFKDATKEKNITKSEVKSKLLENIELTTKLNISNVSDSLQGSVNFLSMSFTNGSKGVGALNVKNYYEKMSGINFNGTNTCSDILLPKINPSKTELLKSVLRRPISAIIKL